MRYKQVKHGLLHGLLTKDRFLLKAPFEFKTRVKGYNASVGMITLTADGSMCLEAGYQWDGASGPTWDTKCTIIASAVHDAFYQLISSGQVPRKERWKADGELWYLMRRHGASPVRAAYYLLAVEMFGRHHL